MEAFFFITKKQKEGIPMKSSTEREVSTYNRTALICFACVVACIVFDVQKYTRSGFSLDWNLALSIALYIILTLLGIRAFRKGRKIKKEN